MVKNWNWFREMAFKNKWTVKIPQSLMWIYTVKSDQPKSPLNKLHLLQNIYYMNFKYFHVYFKFLTNQVFLMAKVCYIHIFWKYAFRKFQAVKILARSIRIHFMSNILHFIACTLIRNIKKGMQYMFHPLVVMNLSRA